MSGREKESAGCFLRGCLVVLLGSAFVALAGAGALFYLYDNVIGQFSAAQPADLSVPAPGHEEYQIARRKLEALRWALSRNLEETIAFTAADLNALVSDHSDFAAARGRVRFGLADSAMDVDLNVPADAVALPRLKGRWFAVRLRTAVEYEYDQFKFSPRSIALGRWHMPAWLLTSAFGSSFSQGFSKNFQQSLQKDSRGAVFWKHVKRISIDGDQLVVTMQKVD
jgi:hypothetical protein